MKKQIILTMLSLAALNVAAQDIIVMRNGDEVEAKVTKVGTAEIEYHKWSNQDGPIYTVPKSDVFMVKYMNGDKDVFCNNNMISTNSDNNPEKGYVIKNPDTTNPNLIDRFNVEPVFNISEEKKHAKQYFPVIGIENTSVMSTEDLEVNFIKMSALSKYYLLVLRTYIRITNKSDKIIYIDKSNCFRIDNGKAQSYYDSKQVTVSSGNSSGFGIGVGAVANALGIGGTIGTLVNGVTVGGGSSSGVSTTYSQQRFLTIPPHSSAYLSEHEWNETKGKWTQISEAETWEMNNLNMELKKGQIIKYTPEDSPQKYNYFITYSFDQGYATYHSLCVNMYVKYIVGASTSLPMMKRPVCCPNAYYTKEEMLKMYDKVISNFSKQPSLLVGIPVNLD